MTIHPSGDRAPVPRSQANEADREALVRLAAVRLAVDAIVSGHWYPEPELLDAITALTASAARWARLAEGWAEAA